MCSPQDRAARLWLDERREAQAAIVALREKVGDVRALHERPLTEASARRANAEVQLQEIPGSRSFALRSTLVPSSRSSNRVFIARRTG